MSQKPKSIMRVSCLFLAFIVIAVTGGCGVSTYSTASGALPAPAASSSAAASAAPAAALTAAAPSGEYGLEDAVEEEDDYVLEDEPDAEEDVADDADYDFEAEPEDAADEADFVPGEPDAKTEESAGGTGSGSSATTAPVTRKIITTIDIHMESTEYDKCANNIMDAVSRAGGYIEYSDIAGSIEAPGSKSVASFGTEIADFIRPMGGDTGSNYRSDRRYMRLKIRIPQSGISDFVSEIAGFGYVLNKQESAEDVTLKYVDIESRKKALALEQERLLEMLGRAQNVEAIIKLEERLSEVRYMLERYESQMRVLENQINYATVNLSLDEVLIYTEKPKDPIPKPTVSQRISSGMQQTFDDIGNYWVNAFVWFMVNIVYIIGTVIVLLAAFIIFRRYRRKFSPGAVIGRISSAREKKKEPDSGDSKPEK